MEKTELGRRVRAVRKARGFSQQDLADAAALLVPEGRAVRQTLSHIETGRVADPSFGIMCALAMACDVPVGALSPAVVPADEWPSLLRAIEAIPPGPGLGRHLIAMGLRILDRAIVQPK